MELFWELDRLAEVAVKVGLGLQEGQELVVTAAVEAAPLARRIAEQAYRNGAALVTVLYEDEAITLSRFLHAPEVSFDRAPGWLLGGMAEAFQSGSARLHIAGSDPNLLKDQNPERVARANRARSLAYQRALELISTHHINWTIVAYPHPAWAQAVFPQLPQEEAVRRLWEAICRASRLDQPDPLTAWAEHNRRLRERVDYLNRKRYQALHFKGPGTDLWVGLAEDHLWAGGAVRAKNGVTCNPNIPTEEVFTAPHKDRVEGHVRSTKPLSYQGSLLEGIEVRFEKGRIVEARAERGGEILERILDTDEGARRLGEVALVPQSSPIAQSGLLFYNTLFDENAASHIALGQAYSECVQGGASLEEEERAAKGLNRSLIHIDWMIGSAEVDVDGVTQDGRSEPLMRAGEWV
ncbi:MAG: aminopeptidase [Meiothermus sp.]|uniref:aminopeptidase n=1 Tax=Meiothermus sp. TaxID=1955249 RepID=UPI0025EB58D3|nr:aminopeptidase [Meiothermus sp.]MCS7058714.1 aminopeptidase [Meiothermus sp.]MCS7194090.1 aminopeptidase [Meiothermus sp.]MDW8089959.1 aminopeptidase [Meiothermus sp.]MDW8480613.1 aminopeptidase [Meiothermus sp.]